MKKLAVLGSTGSIGTQTLEIAREKKDEFSIVSMAALRNVELMEAQIREFHPGIVALYDHDAADELRSRLKASGDALLGGIKVLSGMEGLLAVCADNDADILVTGIVGMIGIRPTIAAIEAGKDIALANKETLVCAGHIIMPLAREKGVKILPVDSEHSAIFQSLSAGHPTDMKQGHEIEKIILTASGGPFLGRTKKELENVSLEAVLRHPNWVMGPKVTIDSASLVNKGLEMMEAHWLFGVESERIQIVIHPQSILHSAVQFVDGAIIGQMGVPDMKLPIQYALTYPGRESLSGKRVDLTELGSLDFMKPDTDTFRGLALAFEAMKRGGVSPSVFNAANEEAVAKLIKGEIGFLQIPELIEQALDKVSGSRDPDVDEIFAARDEVEALLRR